MKMHPSKIRKATQRELFATEEYGSSRGSWLVLDGQGKPDRRAMTSLHGKCRKDGRRREQRELARYLAPGAGTRKGHGFLLSEFEATLELDGPWEATRVILESLHLHPHSHELRYRLHFLHLGEGNLAAGPLAGAGPSRGEGHPSQAQAAPGPQGGPAQGGSPAD